MINSQAATHESWLVRCSPRAPGFSWSNKQSIIINNNNIKNRRIPTTLLENHSFLVTIIRRFPFMNFPIYFTKMNNWNWHFIWTEFKLTDGKWMFYFSPFFLNFRGPFSTYTYEVDNDRSAWPFHSGLIQ